MRPRPWERQSSSVERNPRLLLATLRELLSVNPALHGSCFCGDRTKLSSVVVDHEIKGRRRPERQYEESHRAGAIRVHLVRAFDGHPDDVAVGTERRGCVGMTASVERLAPGLGERAGERGR